MGDVPWMLAVSAGMVAALNPCGFALLPAYLSLLVLDRDAPSRAVALTRAVTSAAALTAGFVAVFVVFGLAVAPVAGLIQRHAPWFTVGFGVALVGLGGWLLAGHELPAVARLVGRAPALRRSAAPMVAFGAAYALASLSCTIGPFLAIVVSSLRAGSIAAGASLFVTYAAGMGLVVGTAAIAVAMARTSLFARIRGLTRVVSRAGGAVVALTGAYVAYYGWYELRLLRGADPADPVITGAGRVQGWLAGATDRLGVVGFAVVFAVLVAGAVTVAVRARRVARAQRTEESAGGASQMERET
jgi:cytochrome c biogenesis protein CcdA